ncbi:cysteine peptidase family C39 domain-containing protein [Siculibacillus lacustris]|nr:cysteine peptidase family C39 domain-containing protein [Siculibacillus lacustris]
MSEYSANDDDGVNQLIWLQERGDTCGPACVYMIERNRAQASLVGGEVRVRQITEMLPNGYSEGNGTADYSALAAVLNTVGIRAEARFVGNISAFVAAAPFPFIARVGWSGGGGHFVVCTKTTGYGNMVALDPWYGLIQPPVSGLPSYPVRSDARQGISRRIPIMGSLSGHMIILTS